MDYLDGVIEASVIATMTIFPASNDKNHVSRDMLIYHIQFCMDSLLRMLQVFISDASLRQTLITVNDTHPRLSIEDLKQNISLAQQTYISMVIINMHVMILHRLTERLFASPLSKADCPRYFLIDLYAIAWILVSIATDIRPEYQSSKIQPIQDIEKLWMIRQQVLDYDDMDGIDRVILRHKYPRSIAPCIRYKDHSFKYRPYNVPPCLSYVTPTSAGFSDEIFVRIHSNIETIFDDDVNDLLSLLSIRIAKFHQYLTNSDQNITSSSICGYVIVKCYVQAIHYYRYHLNKSLSLQSAGVPLSLYAHYHIIYLTLLSFYRTGSDGSYSYYPSRMS